jgi:hypothetical protein
VVGWLVGWLQVGVSLVEAGRIAGTSIPKNVPIEAEIAKRNKQGIH